MHYWILSLIIIICGYLYYYYKKKLSYFEDLGIPYLPGWPIFGNMFPVIFRQKHINECVSDVYNVHPDAKYVGFFDFMKPVIMIRDLELIKTITIKNFDNFPDRTSFIDASLDPLLGGALSNLAGDRWREARHLLSPAFTSSKMKLMFELIVNCGKNFVNYLSDQSQECNKMIDTKDLFTKYTNDAIATCAFGISVDSLKYPNNEFYSLGKKITSTQGILLLKIFFARAYPKIVKFFDIQLIDRAAAKFFTNAVSTTVKTRDEKGISRPDMLQLMMDARSKDNKNLKLDITEMTAQAFIFFFGGFDSTSTQMCIIAHVLALHPDIQKKLQDEIDEVVRKTEGNPTYENINSMLYLDAVFNESMRRYTQVGLLDRYCIKEYELPPALPGIKPYKLKPGSTVWIPTAIHLDPKYYDDPNKFDPDRYYEKKVTINDVSNLGFGIGPRACIGNRFAILETKILFFFLLSKFNLKPNKKTSSPIKFSKSTFSLTAEGGFWLDIEKRE